MIRRRILYRLHAVERMRERSVSTAEIEEAIRSGEVLAERPEGFPHPSRLLLGWAGSRPLHVVVAEDRGNNLLVVITVYEPSLLLWGQDFRRRRLQ